VQYLLKSIYPEAQIPDTIKNVLESLLDVSTVADNPLPGAYPPSLTESETGSFTTTTGGSMGYRVRYNTVHGGRMFLVSSLVIYWCFW
jgi:hypothetical protein